MIQMFIVCDEYFIDNGHVFFLVCGETWKIEGFYDYNSGTTNYFSSCV